MKLPAVFESYRAEIDGELRSILAEYRSPLYDMLRYHLGWIDAQGNPLPGSAGKALRPTLCLLACEAMAGVYRPALPAAASLELMHNFSLIHDDVQDDDRERRHRPTVWSLWGKPQAINAGTAMRIIGNLALYRLGERGVPGQKQLRVQRLLDESCLKLIEGQYLDISYEVRLDIGVNDYLHMVDGKTAALLACSLEVGALLGSDDEATIAAFRRLGRNLGLAFQIRDDILGIWGEEEVTGKPVGSDIRRKKKTLPIVYALEKTQGPAHAELVALYGRPAIDDDALATVLGILDAAEARAHAQSLAQEYCNAAIAEMEGITLSAWARYSLEEMAYFLAKREF